MLFEVVEVYRLYTAVVYTDTVRAVQMFYTFWVLISNKIWTHAYIIRIAKKMLSLERFFILIEIFHTEKLFVARLTFILERPGRIYVNNTTQAYSSMRASELFVSLYTTCSSYNDNIAASLFDIILYYLQLLYIYLNVARRSPPICITLQQ